MKAIKNYGSSVRAKLLNVAHASRQPYQLLVVRYLHERLLYRLSASEYRDRFLLKGGALLFAYDRFEARPTMDIDFLGSQISRDIEFMKSVFAQIASVSCEEDGVRFNADSIEAEEISINKEYNGVRLHITAHIDTIIQKLSMDIGFGDAVTPEAQLLEYPLLLEDLPAAVVRAYSLETVVAEKFQAMVALGENNSRMKDFFDVFRILSNYDLDEDNLAQAIHATFEKRQTTVDADTPLFQISFAEDAMRSQFWHGFLRKIKWHENLEFKTVWSLIVERLQKFL